MAGARVFRRGAEYHDAGRVAAVDLQEGVLRANVLGSTEYAVALWIERGSLEYSCTCPLGRDGSFCKHCVAAGLAWLARVQGARQGPKPPALPAVTMDDVRAWLARQEKAKLEQLLLRHADQDDDLRRQLLLQAALHAPQGPDIASFRGIVAEMRGVTCCRSFRHLCCLISWT